STPPPTTAPYPLSLHDALPICARGHATLEEWPRRAGLRQRQLPDIRQGVRSSRRVNQSRPARNEQSPVTYGDVTGPGEVEDRGRSEEHTSELQSRGHLVCRLLL